LQKPNTRVEAPLIGVKRMSRTRHSMAAIADIDSPQIKRAPAAFPESCRGYFLIVAG
jgi:hypothetical protein